MNERPLVMISTRLSPGACGIGTHSLVLRKHWPGSSDRFEFLVNEGSTGADGLTGGDCVTEFGNRPERLARELDRVGAADVLLHYAGRAYHRFGAPVWMPRVLKEWKQKFPTARLMIFFHELPGKFPVTSRHFWLSRLSSCVVRQLSAIADVLASNTESHVSALRRLSGRADIHLLPIAANIDVVSDAAHTQRQAAEFVVFGLSFGRLQALQSFQTDVPRWHSAGRLTKLHVIGPQEERFSKQADEIISTWPHTIEIVRHGMLPAPDVSRLLQRARFALTNVTDDTWSKSSAFMACATHRCAVIISGPPRQSPPLSYTVAAAEVDRITNAEVENRTSALADWVNQNASWPVIASRIAALLRNGSLTHVG